MATTKKIIMKEFNGTDYDILYPKTNVEQVENLTPSSIGAVSKTGDTMTGNLTIKRDYPQVTMNSPLAGRDAYIAYVGNEKNLFLMNRLDTNNRQGIYITPETSSLSNALRLMRVVDGNESYYNFIHTGNLSDLGVTRIATGFYTGTGTYGSDKPNRLTLPFEPKLLMIAPAAYGIDFEDTNTSTYFYESAIWFAGTTKLAYRDSSTQYNIAYCTFSVSGNTISWYSDTANGLARTQLNTAGTKYAYIAIG